MYTQPMKTARQRRTESLPAHKKKAQSVFSVSFAISCYLKEQNDKEVEIK